MRDARMRCGASICAFLLLSVSAATGAFAGETISTPLTLSEAQHIALADHPALKSEIFDTFAAGEAVKIVRSAYAPQAYGEGVQAFAGPQTRLSAYSALSDPTIIQRTALGVGVSQYITDFGRTTDLLKASELDLQAQEAHEHFTRDTILLHVTRAYFEVLRARSLLLVAEKTKSDRSILLSQVSSLQRAGLRSTLDVGIMRRDVSEADQLVLEARGRLLDAFAVLSETMGERTSQAYTLQDVQKLPALPTNVEDIGRIALRENPSLRSFEAEESAAQKREDAADRSTSPTISGYGFAGATPIRGANQSIASSYAAVGVALTVPIFNGGVLAAEKRQAQDAGAAAAANVDDEKNQLLRDVRIAFEGVRTARGNIDVSDQILQTARQALELTRARYRIGLNSIVDLSAAQLSETQAAISQTNARYDYILQHAALDFAAGILARATF